MSNRSIKAILLVCAGAGALLAATAAANAGGFAVREQSAWGQGSSYAGVAAGGSLSAMFWNPATMTQMPGIQSEAVLSGIFPYAANTVGAGSVLGALGGTGNTADTALVPSGYFSYQFNPSLWFGLSVNAPFGLSVSFPNSWAGRDYAAGDSHLRTYNVAPSFAYRINDWISVGAGIQIQYADAALGKGPTPFFRGFVPLTADLSGTGWGYGFTAGVTLTPTPTTTVGIGYRSAIDQKISGSLAVSGALPPPFTGTTPVSTTINLPDTVSLGLRQRLSPQWTLLGTVEWSNWSRIGTSTVSGAPVPTSIAFQYQDGWLFSVGAEYQWDRQLALRAGVGYEISPITDDVRVPLLPDNDRYWLSVGATYKLTNKLSFDAAYSHVIVKSTPINISATSGNPSFDGITYIGDVSSHIDIVSVGIKYRWDDPAPEPVKQGYFKAK